MPCVYRIFPAAFLLTVSFQGTVSLKDILELMDAVEGDPGFEPGMAEFADLSGLERLRLNPTEIRGISDLTRSLYRRVGLPARSAYWAPNRFHMAASLYCSFFSRVKGANIRTFRRRDDALEFLGLSERDLLTG